MSNGDPTLAGPGASTGLGAAAGRGAGASPGAPEHAVEAAGPPDAPALLLLHGTRRTRAMWRHQLDGLADGFRVVALDAQ